MTDLLNSQSRLPTRVRSSYRAIYEFPESGKRADAETELLALGCDICSKK